MKKPYDPILSQIGNRICQRREERKLTATELAVRANVTAATLSNAENGLRNTGILNICAIADALRVPLSWLQPEMLDAYSENDPSMIKLQQKLNLLNEDQKALMLAMFDAQLETILSTSGRKDYRI